MITEYHEYDASDEVVRSYKAKLEVEDIVVEEEGQEHCYPHTHKGINLDNQVAKLIQYTRGESVCETLASD